MGQVAAVVMHAETIFKRATEAYRKGDFAAALRGCEELSGHHSDSTAQAAILNLKAISLAGQGLMFSAADSIEVAIQLKPADALLRLHASRILLALGRHVAAGLAAEMACELAPGNTTCRYQLARVHLLDGDSLKARELVQQCVKENPGLVEAWLLLSELALDLGDGERAVACLHEIILHDPGNVRVWAALAAIPGQAAGDPAIEKALADIETLAQDSATTATATFALADLDRQRGLFDAAFARYRSANQRLAESQPFALGKWQESLHTMTSNALMWLESTAGPKPTEEADGGGRLVFVVGMPRSGTSLCEQVLCSHPGVYGAGELPTMEFIAKALAHEGIDPFHVGSEPDSLKHMCEAYLGSLPTRSANHVRVIDKTPRNFERLGLIFRLFPGARVLWCLRHPLDTILSCYFQDFHGSQQFSHNLDQCAWVYIEHIRLLRHWLLHCGNSIKVVEYPCLVQDLAGTAQEMADFIGVEFHASMLQPQLNTRNVRTASSHQLRQPVYTTSLDQWRHYRKELAGVCVLLQQQGVLDQQGRSIPPYHRVF
jgi:tetratricopeptide (TPR) repeat protein